MTTTQDPIAHAARLLREAAEELRQAHAFPGSEGWENETDAKAAYDEHMAAAQALEDWEAAAGAGGVQALSAAQAVHASVKGAMWFTKKPVTIQAIQWTGDNLREVITFTDGPPDTRSHHAGMAWDAYRDLVARDGLKIYTLEGKMLASPGDWIIRGVKGELYPCKPDIFQETYAAASPTPPVEQQAAKVAPAIGDELRDTLVAVSAAIAEQDDRTAQKMIREILEASPTPPAEQATTTGAALGGVYAELPQPDSWFHFTPQYWENTLRDFADRTHALRMQAAKAAPGEPDYSKKWDAELGRTAMRFVDRAGDVHPGIDDTETICAEFHKAMSEVIERMPHVQRMAAPQQEPSPTAGMNIAQRILHVGGRNNAAGYVEFGSIQAVEALVRQVLRDLPATEAPHKAPAESEQDLRGRFEALARDSYNFKRSRRDCYVNPAMARDWKWFRLGANAAAQGGE